jgi:hypothetical protein
MYSKFEQAMFLHQNPSCTRVKDCKKSINYLALKGTSKLGEKVGKRHAHILAQYDKAGLLAILCDNDMHFALAHPGLR